MKCHICEEESTEKEKCTVWIDGLKPDDSFPGLLSACLPSLALQEISFMLFTFYPDCERSMGFDRATHTEPTADILIEVSYNVFD